MLDRALLASMVASGIHAACETLELDASVTINENAAEVYIATRDKRLFRIRVTEIVPPKSPDEEDHV